MILLIQKSRNSTPFLYHNWIKISTCLSCLSCLVLSHIIVCHKYLRKSPTCRFFIEKKTKQGHEQDNDENKEQGDEEEENEEEEGNEEEEQEEEEEGNEEEVGKVEEEAVEGHNEETVV